MDQAQQLRNMIQKQNEQQKHSARVITITSGKGGVGKSNVSVNLAIQLSRLNKRVIVLDADFGLANVEIMLGLRPQYSLADVMFHEKSIKDVITSGPENIGFISGGSGIKEMTNLTADQIHTLLSKMYELDQLADVVIIDTGAGISDMVIELLAATSEILLVATPEPTSLTDAYALLKTLNNAESFHQNETKIRMIGNRIQNYDEGKELYEKLSSVSERFLQLPLEYLGAIPYDDKLQRAVMRQVPVSILYPNAPSARALCELAAVLDNRPEEKKDVAKGITEMFHKIFRMHR